MSIRAAHGRPWSGTSAGNGSHPEARSIIRATLLTLGAWILRRGERRALKKLAHDGRLLSDNGASEQAVHEAAKPPWRR